MFSVSGRITSVTIGVVVALVACLVLVWLDVGLFHKGQSEVLSLGSRLTFQSAQAENQTNATAVGEDRKDLKEPVQDHEIAAVEDGTPYHKAFLINCRAGGPKIHLLSAAAKEAGVGVEIVNALDWAHMDLKQLTRDSQITADIAETMLKSTPRDRVGYACTLSHNQVLQRIAAESPERVFLVFEDDPHIPEGFHRRLLQALGNIPSDWDCLFLQHHPLVGEVVDDRFWLKPFEEGKPMTKKKLTKRLRNAYLVTPAGARRILKFQSPISFKWSGDHNMRQHFEHFTAYVLVFDIGATGWTFSSVHALQ